MLSSLTSAGESWMKCVMSTKREIRDYLEDILQSTLDIREFTAGMTFDQFTGDRRMVNAVIRGLELIGEATKSPSRIPVVPSPPISRCRRKEPVCPAHMEKRPSAHRKAVFSCLSIVGERHLGPLPAVGANLPGEAPPFRIRNPPESFVLPVTACTWPAATLPPRFPS
jgi:hypothetical protein